MRYRNNIYRERGKKHDSNLLFHHGSSKATDKKDAVWTSK
jgi:hypothetical protein